MPQFMPHTDDDAPLRRRGDSAAIAGQELRLYRLDGRLARIGILPPGAGEPVPFDVLEAIQTLLPHGEWPGGGGPAPTQSADRADPSVGWDVILRIGRSAWTAGLMSADCLDVAYLFQVDGDPRLHTVTASADRVLVANRQLGKLLAGRHAIQAELLYPGIYLPPASNAERSPEIVRLPGELPRNWDTALRLWKGCHGQTCTTCLDLKSAAAHGLPAGLVVPRSLGSDSRVLEATALGVPVIVERCSPAAEWVRPFGEAKPTGLLVNSDDPSELLDAMELIRNHPELFGPKAMRAHAERYSAERFRKGLSGILWRAWTEHLGKQAEGAFAAEAPAENLKKVAVPA